MDAEKVALKSLFGLRAVGLAVFDDFHRVGTTVFKNVHPKFQFVLQFLTGIGVGRVGLEDVFHSLAARIHVLNALNQTFEQLEATVFGQSLGEAFLQKLDGVFYLFPFLKFRASSLHFFLLFFCSHCRCFLGFILRHPARRARLQGRFSGRLLQLRL